MLRKAVTVCSLVVAFVFFASLAVPQGTNTAGAAGVSSGDSVSVLACDPNGDGVLDAKDVIVLLKFLLQATPLPVGGTGDCNGDTKVDPDFRDLLALLKLLKPAPV